MTITYDESKFIELTLHVADRLRDDRAGGATKLNKVLYFADFAHMRRHGRPITGAEYQKLPQGPAPRRFMPVRARLCELGHAEVVTEHFLGYRLDRLVALRPPNLSVFDTDELSTVDEVLADLAHLTSSQVSELSHEEAPWQLAADGETIPYVMAFVAKDQISTPASRRLAAEVAERYGITVAS